MRENNVPRSTNRQALFNYIFLTSRNFGGSREGQNSVPDWSGGWA